MLPRSPAPVICKKKKGPFFSSERDHLNATTHSAQFQPYSRHWFKHSLYLGAVNGLTCRHEDVTRNSPLKIVRTTWLSTPQYNYFFHYYIHETFHILQCCSIFTSFQFYYDYKFIIILTEYTVRRTLNEFITLVRTSCRIVSHLKRTNRWMVSHFLKTNHWIVPHMEGPITELYHILEEPITELYHM